jgi:hypothetical protein
MVKLQQRYSKYRLLVRRSLQRRTSLSLFHPSVSRVWRTWMAFGELTGAPVAAAEFAQDAPRRFCIWGQCGVLVVFVAVVMVVPGR